MVKEEVDFPRGGKKQISEDGKQNKPGGKFGPQTQEGKEKPQSRKRQNADESPFEQPSKKFKKKDHVHVESPLQNDALCMNMVVLACVKNVHPHSISVSLPGNKSATVSVTNLSEAYSMQLQQLSMDDEFDQTDVIVAATEFLKPGFFIPVALKSISDDKGNNRRAITGSFRPSDIAVGMLKSDVQDGMLLMGNVSSVEDHGYRIDTGIKGLQVFLRKTDTQVYIDKCCPGKQLCIGQPLWCVVQMKDKKSVDKSENRVVNVMIDPDMVEKATLPQKTKMNMLLPGMKVTAHVKTVGEQGLLVTFGAFEGFLHNSHVSSSVSSYSVNQAIDAAILYVHPESKTIHLTALDEIVKQNGNAIDMFSGMEIGDTVQANILRLVKKKGIYFKLPHSKKGFAALSQLSDDTEAPDLNNYKTSQNIKCRVMGFNHMEGLVLVTLKISILQQKFISFSSLKPGDVTEATIVNVLPKGVSVMLSKKMYSFIPSIHMANVPIAQLSKKFESGMQLKCRVMEVDAAKSKVSLTHKPAMLKSKALIPTEYTQLSPGVKVTGVITVLKETFLIVRFFNGVQGLVMLSDMGLEHGQSPVEHFYLGQVVRCRVVDVNPDEEKLKLSFNVGGQKVEKVPEEIYEPLELTAGLVTGAKITAIGKNFYKLILTPSKHPAILPFDHLSDFPDIQDLRKLTFNKGHILSKVTFFNKKRRCTVTMKESFIKAAEDKLYAPTFEDLEVGMLLPGVIKNHQDYGFFVELAGGLTGLCPARTLATAEPSDMKDMYPEGRSVLIRVVRIDKEKERFLGGISKQDCVRDGDDDPARFLQEYLESRDLALKELTNHDVNLKPYGDVKIGSCIDVTVTNVYKKGVLCALPSGLKAIATHDHLGAVNPEPGKQYSAVVLDLDVSSPCLEVTLDSKFYKAVETRVDNPSSQVKIGQTLKAELLLIKEGFLLMKLKGHGTGKLVYIPVKQHFNDVYVPPGHKIGMYSNVVIKGNIGGFFIGILKTRERKSSKTETDKAENQQGGKENVDIRNLPLHDIQVGNVIEAKVKSVHPFQMNITGGRIQGRVHVTEVTDDKVKKNPLIKYKKGDALKVKVIGLRNMKMQSYMPVTKPKVSRTLLECTLKESKMGDTDPKDLMNEELSTFIGAEMTVYVIKVDKTKLWVQASLIHQGFISLFQVSNNVEVINNAAKHFKVGQPIRATVIGKTDNDKINFSLIGPEATPEIGTEVTTLITGAKQSEYLSVKLYKGYQGIVDSYPGASVSIGKYVKCKVVSVSNIGVYQLSLTGNRKRKASESDQEIEETGKKENTEVSAEEENGDGQIVKKKAKKVAADGEEKEASVREENGDGQIVKKKAKKASADREEKSVLKEKKVKKDSQKVDASHVRPKTVNNSNEIGLKGKKSESAAPSKKRLTVAGFAWGGDLNIKSTTQQEVSDDDDDEDDVGNAVAESKTRRKRNREQEKIIEEYEKQQIDGKSGPQSVNDFERLVLQSPNSSMVWLGFMAYHMELGEVAKARAVAEKALNTIVFREEQEKKNVWLAYLNLETMYGESEDLKKLLQRAVTYNDPLDINLKMCDIYVGANKIEDAEQQYHLLIKKFKKQKVVWKSYAQFLYKQDRHESARNILKQCLTALDKRDHVEVISRFANLEFSHGNPERGRTMFENLIASYPGRTDIWSVYVDMVVKSGDIAGARQLLERAVKQKLNTKKLSFLIQKFIKFEETHGSDDQVQKVKDMAISLFDS